MDTVEIETRHDTERPAALKPFVWLDEKPATPVFKHIRELKRQETTTELAHRVAGSRALLVNYGLIQHDFPFLREDALIARFPKLKRMTAPKRNAGVRRLIDDWLVENTAFMSKAQAAQTAVNTPIPIGEETTQAFRPPEYGRALVFSLRENAEGMGFRPGHDGLLDVKGVGVAPGVAPDSTDHSNGLLQLGIALLEVVYQQLIEKVFRHAGGLFDTLPIYGVVDLGFDIKWADGRLLPAGLLVRRAHVRQWYAGGFPASRREEVYMFEIELLLRKYGLNSTCWGTTYSVWEEGGEVFTLNKLQRQLVKMKPGAARQLRKHFRISHQPIEIQCANVQLTRDLNTTRPKTTLVDFTHYNVADQFTHPIYTPKHDAVCYRGNLLRLPGDPDFPQPDPRLRIPFYLTGQKGCLWGFPAHGADKKATSLCFALADEFRAGKLSREAVAQYLGTYLDLISRHLD